MKNGKRRFKCRVPIMQTLYKQKAQPFTLHRSTNISRTLSLMEEINSVFRYNLWILTQFGGDEYILTF